jgi:hypothetical protein
MALQDVAPILAKEFIPLMLDYDRATGARDIQKRYIEKEQGLPWFVFLDGDGKKIVSSTGPKGNVGFPYQPDEIAYFKVMLEQLQREKRRLTAADIAYLVKSLEETKKKIEAGGGR